MSVILSVRYTFYYIRAQLLLLIIALQRQEYKNLKQGKPTTLDERRVKLLNDIGFVWSVQRGGKRKAPSSSGNEHREPDSFQDDERTVRPGNDQKKGTESANNNDDTSITQAVAAQEQPRKTVQRSSTRETKRQKIDEVVARGEDTIGSTQISNTPATSIQSPVYSLPQSTSLPIGFPSLGQGQSATFTSDITADLASLQNNRFLSRQSSLPSLSSHHATAQLQSLLSGVTSQASQSSLPFYSGGVGRISNSENELNQVLASFHRRQQPQRLQLPHNSNLPLVLALERQLGPVSGSSPVSRTFEISNNSLLELQMQYQRVLGRQPYHYHRALGQGDTRLQNDPLAFLYLNRSGTGREAASNLASSELLNLARRERSNSNAPYILPPFPGVPRTFGEQGDNELADDSKTSDSDLVPGR